MKVQFVTDDKGQPSGVFMTMKQYKKLLQELEELDAIRAYDKAKAHTGTTRPFDTFLQELHLSSVTVLIFVQYCLSIFLTCFSA